MLQKDKNYQSMLESIKQQVLSNQHIAAMAVNSRLLYTYWLIGAHILHEQEKQGWGTKVVEQLAKDLSAHFVDMKGFSTRNLVYMRQFANEWPINLIAQQAVAQMELTKN